jgi:DNA-binding XRE family transcriptional regulator
VSTTFGEFLEEIEAEAQAEGPAAVAEIAAFDERYRLAHQLMVRRRELGMSQARLAKLSGVGQADISRIEGGRANPTVGTLAAVARSLGMGLGLVPLDERTAGRAAPAKPAAGRGRRAAVPS